MTPTVTTLANISGPKGSTLPIIASSLVIDLYNLIAPTSSGGGNYAAYESALSTLKECGFNGFITRLDYYVDANETDKTNRKGFITEVLSRAHAKGIFVMVLSNVFEEPNATWLSSAAAEGVGKTEKEQIKVYTDKYNKQISAFLSLCRSTSGFGGAIIKDEPTQAQMQIRFDDQTATIQSVNNQNGSFYCVSNRYKIVASLLNDNEVVMVNLIGERLSTYVPNTYFGYLENFYNLLDGIKRPYLWTYDLYPILENNYLLQLEQHLTPSLPNNGEVTIRDPKWVYEDTELFYQFADRCKGAYWYYCQSMTYMNGRDYSNCFYHPLPLEAYLRYEIFTNLAMGCQGIMYWTYHQRLNNQELFLSAPINMHDKKTATWYYAKKINAEIRKFNDVFRGSKLVNWGHIGEIYPNCKIITETFACFSSLSASGKGILLTHLSNTSGKYVMVVSHDVVDYQEVSLVYDATRYNVERLNASSSSTKSGLTREFRITLPPGDYILFKWDNI